MKRHGTDELDDPQHILHEGRMPTIVLVLNLAIMIQGIRGQELIGHWDGTIGKNGSGKQFHVFFKQAANSLFSSDPFGLMTAAVIDMPDQGIRGVEATKVRFSFPEVYFEFSGGAGNLRTCSGRLGTRYPSARLGPVERLDQIIGYCTDGDTHKSFILRRATGR